MAATGPDPWTQLVVNVGLTAVAHPMGYVKTLVQIGFEPLPPKLGRNLFFRQCWQLPGFFDYASHIRKVDGFFGLYRGFFPRVCGTIVGAAVSKTVGERMDEFFPVSDEKDREALKKKPKGTAKVSTQTFLAQTSKLTVSHCCAVIASHPFHVVAVRSMVQFVGRETKYSGWFSPYSEVYQQNGILGFFAGLIPRMLLDILSLWIGRTLYHLFNTLLLDDEMANVGELRSYAHAVTGFAGGMVTYPFGLVSNIMAVNDSGLVAGSAPFTPVYTSWLDCWRDLSRNNLLKRGNSLFFRRVPTKLGGIHNVALTPLD
ncbi:mitochondrial carrier homolog 2-like [Amphiura filiformis]|uniref:mitochondrial carrier homolog 2-like n=1 Tax=Amphiura filiformis TaxID=82378 RepID=UPI003B219416